jgi:hypothetical protein
VPRLENYSKWQIRQRASRSAAVTDFPVEKHDLLIDGQFEIVDEGDPFRRVIIGFGSGAARLEIRASVF